jgi:mono/diheme cytochrome c family protein
MWDSKGVLFVAIFAALAMVSAGSGVFPSSSKQESRSVSGDVQELTPLIRSVEGPELFKAYCATCHGLDGRGNGPAAAAMKTKPADLTVLAKSNRGQFPTAQVRDTITGEKVIASHGSREMPIWGPIFHQVEADVDRGHVRVENLMKYLESIQTVGGDKKQVKSLSQTVAPKEPSGNEIFRQDCAVCHVSGANSPAVPSPFRTPPDLSTLAQRHGGKFPETYVKEVLQNGVELPAHGPAEMPIWGTDFVAKDKLTEQQVGLRIAELTDYLKSIQAK